MAVVGSAYIVVNAITTGFKDDIDDILNGLESKFARAGSSFGRGFTRNAARSMSNFEREALGVYQSINGLIEKSYYLQGALGVLIPALGSVAAGLTVMALEAAAATPSFIVLGGVIAAFAQGMAAFKLAFSGVGKAIGSLTKPKSGIDKMPQLLRAQADATDRVWEAERRLEKAIKASTDAREQARREIERLKYDNEDAVISEKRAVIELEKAREQLLRVQDLPPNTRARREAELAFAEADLNLRRARSSVKDLQIDLNKATKNGTLNKEEQIENSETVLNALENELDAQRALNKANDAKLLADKAVQDEKSGTGGGGGQDPMAGLNEYQKEFAKFIAGLKPQLDKLKLSVSQGLLPALQEAITTVNEKLFPTIDARLKETGVALGKAAKDFADAITTPAAITNLSTVMGTSNYVLENTGIILGNLARLVEALLAAADPLIRRFTDWIRELTGGWADSAEGNISGLTDMFNHAGDIAAGFGDIIGNIVGAFMNMGRAVTGKDGAGQTMLDWFIDLSQRFEDFTAKHLASGKLKEYFDNAWEGFSGILGILGDIVKAILKAGGDKSLSSMTESIGEGVRALIEMMPEIIAAGVAFAKFLGKFLELTATFLEAGSVQAFFGIVGKAIDIVIRFLQIPFVTNIFLVLAAMHGLRLGIGRVSKGIETLGKYIAGDYFNFKKLATNTQNVVKNVQGMSDSFVLASQKVPGLGKGMMGLTTAFEGLGLGAYGSVAAVGVFLAAVAAVVAIIVLAYKYSETFRESISHLVEAVGGALRGAFDKINEAIAIAMPQIGSLSGVFKAIGDFLGTFVVPMLEVLFVNAINIAADVIVAFIKIIGGIIDIFKAVWDYLQIFWRLFRGDFKGAGQAFLDMWKNIASGLGKIFGAIGELLKTVFKGAINWVIRKWNALDFKIPSVTIFGQKIGGFTLGLPNIPELAAGGIVMPSQEGTLARIGEAGRPERVEPLDENGLSKRDKAMITMLAGGKGGGVTINVHPSPGMDEVELASLVSRQLAFQLRAGSI